MKPVSIEIRVLVEDYSGFNSRGLLAEHGLAIWIELAYGDGSKARILLDAGQSGEVLVRNAKALNTDLRSLNLVALSHSHYDHSGGLKALAKEVGERIPLVLHPEALRPSYALRPALTSIGIPASVSELEKMFLLTPSEKLVEIAPGAYFLGTIPRYFESHVPPSSGLYVARERGLEPYRGEDDTALAISIEGFGDVVITGCSHSGVTNIVKHATEILDEEIKLVVGGLHLVSAPRNLVKEVATKLRELGVRYAFVGHCTGFEAEKILSEELGSGFAKIHVGFGARVSSKGIEVFQSY